jgi:cell shape-determining protein MreC
MFEHTPREMAEKLLEFIRDFSDTEEDIEMETEYITELFDKLQKSDEFSALAAHLDIMFMDEVFK